MHQIRQLSARSVVLSLLLGAHPPELAVRDLVAVADQFEIAESTLLVIQRANDELPKIFRGDWLENEHAHPGEERAVHLE